MESAFSSSSHLPTAGAAPRAMEKPPEPQLGACSDPIDNAPHSRCAPCKAPCLSPTKTGALRFPLYPARAASGMHTLMRDSPRRAKSGLYVVGRIFGESLHAKVVRAPPSLAVTDSACNACAPVAVACKAGRQQSERKGKRWTFKLVRLPSRRCLCSSSSALPWPLDGRPGPPRSWSRRALRRRDQLRLLPLLARAVAGSRSRSTARAHRSCTSGAPSGSRCEGAYAAKLPSNPSTPSSTPPPATTRPFSRVRIECACSLLFYPFAAQAGTRRTFFTHSPPLLVAHQRDPPKIRVQTGSFCIYKGSTTSCSVLRGQRAHFSSHARDLLRGRVPCVREIYRE